MKKKTQILDCDALFAIFHAIDFSIEMNKLPNKNGNVVLENMNNTVYVAEKS